MVENDDDDDEIHNEDNDNDANNDNPKSEEKIMKMLCWAATEHQCALVFYHSTFEIVFKNNFYG